MLTSSRLGHKYNRIEQQQRAFRSAHDKLKNKLRSINLLIDQCDCDGKQKTKLRDEVKHYY